MCTLSTLVDILCAFIANSAIERRTVDEICEFFTIRYNLEIAKRVVYLRAKLLALLCGAINVLVVARSAYFWRSCCKTKLARVLALFC